MQSHHLAGRTDVQPDFALAIDVEQRSQHRELGEVEDNRRRRSVLGPDIDDELLAVRYFGRKSVVLALDDEFVLTFFLRCPSELPGQWIELRIGGARFQQLERNLIERIRVFGFERQLGFTTEKYIQRAAESDFRLMV